MKQLIYKTRPGYDCRNRCSFNRHLLTLKCTKFDFGRGYAPDHAEGACRDPPDPTARFEGPTSKGREGN